MRKLVSIAALICLVSYARAETSFVDDAPEGFIHIRYSAESSGSDVFVRTTKIVSVEVYGRESEGKKLATVLVRTTGRKRTDGLSYNIDCATHAEALTCAKRIMALTAAKD